MFSGTKIQLKMLNIILSKINFIYMLSNIYGKYGKIKKIWQIWQNYCIYNKNSNVLSNYGKYGKIRQYMASFVKHLCLIFIKSSTELLFLIIMSMLNSYKFKYLSLL